MGRIPAGAAAGVWVLDSDLQYGALFRKQIVGLFVTGESARAIVLLGSQYLGTMAFFYIYPGFTNGFQGFYRGMGMMKMTLLGTFIQTSLRVIATWILAPRVGIYGVAFACAIGWSVMLLVEIPYYFYYRKKWLPKA